MRQFCTYGSSPSWLSLSASQCLILCLCFFFALSSKTNAQWQKLEGRFTNYDVLDGLSDRGCNVAVEGNDGFIWIGTNEGLNRFDGEVFKHYFYDQNDTNSLIGNIVIDIEKSDSGLWIGTSNGLCFYNHFQDQFERFDFSHFSENGKMSHIKNIFPNGKGQLFLAFYKSKVSEGGLLLFDPKTKTCKEFQALKGKSVQGMTFLPGDDSGLWTAGEFFGRLDLEKDEFTSYSEKEDPFAWDVYNRILVHEGKLFIATWSYGILEFDPVSRSYLGEYHFDPDPYLQRNVIRSIQKKNDSVAYITSADRGFGEFNLNSKQFSFYKNDRSDPYSIPYISGRNTAFDSQGNLLISMAAGLSIKSPYTHQIPFYPFRDYEKQNERTSSFRNTHLSDDLMVCAVSYSKEYPVFRRSDLSYYGAIKGISGVEMVQLEKRIFTMSVGKVYELFPVELEAKLVVDLRRDLNASGFSGNVNTLHPSMDGGLYLGSDDNSIHHYDPHTKTLRNWWLEGSGPTSGRPNVVFEIAETGDGSRWASCALGLYVLQDTTIYNAFERYPILKALEDQTLIAIAAHEDELVIGSEENGLFVYDLKLNTLKHYGRKEGIAGLRIGELTVDQEGNVWGLGSNGLFSYLKESKSIENYGLDDGLLSYDLVTDEINTMSDGRIFVGYGKGLSFFHPKALKKSPFPKKTVLLSASGNGVKLARDSSFQFKRLLTFPNDIDRLELDFKAICVVNAQKVRYAYRLLGHEDEWKETRQGSAIFTGLRGGNYRFEVKTGLEDGRWDDRNIMELSIHLPVSWYRSNWFFLLCFLTVVGLVIFLAKWRLDRIRKQSAQEARYQQKLAETEMMALRAQMNPHFLFNCLNSIKFFIINNQPDKASDYLGKFGRLIRLILQNSEESVITLDLELEALQLYVELEALRFENKFHFGLKVSKDVSTEMIEIPPLIIQPFVENAIWHGLMHAQYQGVLNIEVSLEDETLICVVEDNGVGRAEAARLKSKSVMKKKSMGLDITKNRLKLMDNNESNANSVHIEDLVDEHENARGTRVTLNIPI
jgi:ligand-binding sensor domain-containing protein